MRNARQVLAKDAIVTDDSSEKVTLAMQRHSRQFQELLISTREERRRLLEASVALAAADYVVDQEWHDASLYGSDS